MSSLHFIVKRVTAIIMNLHKQYTVQANFFHLYTIFNPVYICTLFETKYNTLL